ncbi:MAG: NAD(P)/FAD-dependent oxidoreductase [Luteimonas sp.]|nr:NAD(P)/FAD-dependent oxidoreductase [Luteimonas sp.]
MAAAPNRHDVIVVGGSFAGLSAAMQIARARRRVLVVDAGRPRNRFAAHSHGFLGQDGRIPQAITRIGREQLLAYPTVTFEHDEVVAAQSTDAGFFLTLASGARAHAARLVLATGVEDDLPTIPGLGERWGRTVLHCPYCHGYEVAGSTLGVLATMPGSVHQALLVADWGEVVLFADASFALDDAQRSALATRGVRIEAVPVLAMTTAVDGYETIVLADGREVTLSALFVATRTRPSSALAELLGCAFDDGPQGPVIRVDAKQATTVAGVFAAGDAASAMSNATLASAGGVLAGVFAHQSLAIPV